MGFKAGHNLQSIRGWYELKPAMFLQRKNALLPVNETAHRNYDGPQADATVTYSLISAVGKNIHYQHNSSSGISIFLESTSHFIPIQWHSKLSILDSDQSKVIRLKYIPCLRSQNLQSFKQFNTYLEAVSALFRTNGSFYWRKHFAWKI